jgi:putative Mg2+ transporter-C (MgtC) family protein
MLTKRMSLELELPILYDVMIAAALSGVIGFEREAKGKPAGLRTHILLGMSVALLMALSYPLTTSFQAIAGTSLRVDPMNLIQAVLVGIAFIGGGVIIKGKDGTTVKNLTTAASILLVAAISIGVVLNLYILAISITIVGLSVNLLLGKLEEAIS